MIAPRSRGPGRRALSVSTLGPAVCLIFCLAICLPLAACSHSASHDKHASVPDVGVYIVTPQRYTVRTTLPGRTAAYMQSQVRPQVEGIIQKRLFKQGAQVSAGDVLYVIDPARYAAALAQAKAQLAQAKAKLGADAPLARRYTALARIDAISKQDRDNALATLAQDKADIASAKANLTTAQINLDYTKIEAPISGRIGASTVTPGALVTTNQTDPLTTITQLNPIYVDIQQSSDRYLALKRAVDSGTLKTDAHNAAPVTITPEGSDLKLSGKLLFSGVTVDADTGSVMLRALVPNPQHDLLPGMYVQATLVQGIDVKALLVPQQAISRNQRGAPSVLVVNDKQQIEQRSVTLSGTTDNHLWRVASGLAAGARVVVQGSGKVQPGQKVTTTRLVMIHGALTTAPNAQSGAATSGNG